MNIKKLIYLFSIIFLKSEIFCQDTIRINIYQADSIFIKNSYLLLAQEMNIESKKALMLQSKLYPNPILTADFNVYDPENKIPFHVDNTGQKVFQFEQLILLGGKRKQGIEIAKTNTQIAELEFQDLIRKIKFELHNSLYNLNQYLTILNIYAQQLEFIENILKSYEIQTRKGNIALKDLVRLKGVYINLYNSKSEIKKEYYNELNKVQTILQTNKVIKPLLENEQTAAVKIDLKQLVDEALKNRPDVSIMEKNIHLTGLYYKIQKANAVPDINLFTSYDQRGGAFNNQINAGISFALPVWNRNQGNIKAAKYEIKEQEYLFESYKNEIITSINNTYQKYNHIIEQYEKTKKIYNEDFDESLKGITSNFQKGNVSLIEFVDFFESYNISILEMSKLKIQLSSIKEEINYIISKEIFK